MHVYTDLYFSKMNILSFSGIVPSIYGAGKPLLFHFNLHAILIVFSLIVKVAPLIFISGRGPAITSAKEGKSGFIYNLVKS